MSFSLDRALAWPLGKVPPTLTYSNFQSSLVFFLCLITQGSCRSARGFTPSRCTFWLVPSLPGAGYLHGLSSPSCPAHPGFWPAAWSSEMASTGSSLSHLHLYFLLSYRTFTNLRLTKKRCISAISISFVTCICRPKTTQVSGKGKLHLPMRTDWTYMHSWQRKALSWCLPDFSRVSGPMMPITSLLSLNSFVTWWRKSRWNFHLCLAAQSSSTLLASYSPALRPQG